MKTLLIQDSGLLDTLTLLMKTVQLRPYVFLFLAGFLFFATHLIGWPRTWRFWLISWATAFVCEFSSTRNGFPFGSYHYTGSTVGQELYLFNIPFMTPISFSFLLYAAYCVALCLTLPIRPSSASTHLILKPLHLDVGARASWSVFLLTAFLFAFIDMVIDPVALRGDRWFLGKIYYYDNLGIHFGVPLTNYVGWFVVGVISLAIYFPIDRRLPEPEQRSDGSVTSNILMGCGLYYSVLLFNLTVTFWIDEPLIGMTGILIYIPLTVLLLLRLLGKLPAPATQSPPDHWMVDGSRLVTVPHRFHEHGPSSLHEAGSEGLKSSVHHQGDRLLGQDARTLDTISRSK